MSRTAIFALVGLTSSLVACGSSNDESRTQRQRIEGDSCAPDQTDCNTPKQPPIAPPIAPPGGPQCFVADLTLTMCLDQNTLRSFASQACAARGTSLGSTLAFRAGNCGPVDPTHPTAPTDPTEPPQPAASDDQRASDDPRDGTGGLEPKPDALASAVSFSCCAQPPPPPPPPTERCVNVEPVRPAVCTSKDAAAQVAQETCAQRNFTYRDMTLASCDQTTNEQPSSFTLKSVTCCDAIAYPTQPPDVPSDKH